MALLTGCPSEVVVPLLRFVRDRVEHPGVGWFDIGRSVHPPSRCSAKGCDDLTDLYSTTSIERAKIVETWLLQRLRGHRKLRARAFDARGGVAEGRQYVYMLTGAAWDRRVLRDALDWGRWIPSWHRELRAQ